MSVPYSGNALDELGVAMVTKLRNLDKLGGDNALRRFAMWCGEDALGSRAGVLASGQCIGCVRIAVDRGAIELLPVIHAHFRRAAAAAATIGMKHSPWQVHAELSGFQCAREPIAEATAFAAILARRSAAHAAGWLGGTLPVKGGFDVERGTPIGFDAAGRNVEDPSTAPPEAVRAAEAVETRQLAELDRQLAALAAAEKEKAPCAVVAAALNASVRWSRADPGWPPERAWEAASQLTDDKLPPSATPSLASDIAQLVVSGVAAPWALRPFVLVGASFDLVFESAFHYGRLLTRFGAAGMSEEDLRTERLRRELQVAIPDDESLPGPLALVAALSLASNSVRKGCILNAALSLGDERILPLIADRWQDLCTREDQEQVATLRCALVRTLQVEFLLAWLQGSKDPGAVRLVANALAALPAESPDRRVYQVRRCFPAHYTLGKEQIETVESWSFPEYATKMRSRLQAIAESSPDPVAVVRVLESWEAAN